MTSQKKPLRVHIVSLLAVLALALLAFGQTQAAPPSAGIAPNPVNNLDCNGYSKAYKSIRPAMKELCTDPIAIYDGEAYRFYDNGHYVGHDEPSVKFISSDPTSGYDQTYFMRLATDPSCTPTTAVTGTTCSDYAELSPAPWFGLPICDPKSYPQNPCTPDSDSNSGAISDPQAAGSAFMELQFYPPGYPPFIDGPSCDATHWCAALNIDSLECNFGFTFCNPNCIEPVNFAYLQTDGVPAGPPSPQLANVNTFTPNSKTLLMNPGDLLEVIIQDTRNGLLTEVIDHTTNQRGFMVASATNGFMDTDLETCNGTPFNFHPEYNTARQQNQVPWAALEGGVLMENEIGHFEPCSSVRYRMGASEPGFNDPNVYQTCQGGFEPNGVGEGPCVFTELGTIACAHATTEGGGSCPSDDPTSGFNCEFADAFCMPAGPRPVTINGTTQDISWPIAGCEQDFFQNGDLDFDGSSYIADWPDGSRTHPTPFRYSGPFDGHHKPYPQIQFETDLATSEEDCNVETGAGCTAPPVGAAFYPFWTLGREVRQTGLPKGCVWDFGNTIPGLTINSFGGDAEYGTPDTARFGGTLTSAVMPNPALGNSCPQ
jgi:hypothetical protein